MVEIVVKEVHWWERMRECERSVCVVLREKEKEEKKRGVRWSAKRERVRYL